MSIPVDVYEIFKELKNELIWANSKWFIYTRLYSKSEECIHLLEAAAGDYFSILQYMFVDDIKIVLCKFADPAKTNGNHNLSLPQLQERLESSSNQLLAQKNKKLLERIRTQIKPFKKWRDKKIAHNDMETILKKKPFQLPVTSKKSIENALKSIAEYLNNIESYYEDSITMYDHFIFQSGPDQLLTLLGYGLRYDKLIRSGALSYDDLDKIKWKDA